ncbi:hypothetical protein CHUAL_008910 [Chamberlinius hualienensis]
MAESAADLCRIDCQALLINLKSTVEVLLGNQSSNVWNTYGGLSRLTKVVANIFSHRSKLSDPADCWNFILGLRVLIPTIAPWLEKHRLATEGNASRSYLWIQQRLQEHTLSSYLKVLLDDLGHLSACYHDGAFLRQPNFAEALLVCLRAIEDNQLKLLSEIDPNLLVHKEQFPKFVRKHVRSPSLPVTVSQGNEDKCKSVCGLISSRQEHQLYSDTGLHHRARYLYKLRASVDFPVDNAASVPKSTTWDCNLSQITANSSLDKSQENIRRQSSHQNARKEDHRTSSINIKPVISRSRSESSIGKGQTTSQIELQGVARSLNNLFLITESDLNLKKKSEIPLKELSACCSSKKMNRSPSHARSRSDIVHSINTNRLVVDGEGSGSHNLPMSASLPNVLQPDINRSNTEEEFPPQPIFRRPVEGQSLTSFLSSQDFRTCADLDKENAHFSISEALIAAIEQIKCNQMLKIAEEEDQESDDEEIKHLKQRIRIRKRQKLQEKLQIGFNSKLHSDGCTDTTNTSQTPSPRSTSSEKSSSSSVDPLDISDGSEVDTKLSNLCDTGLSLSMASLYSDADIQRPVVPPSPVTQESLIIRSQESSGSLSAESVALNLLKRFSEKQLPKASDLEWLVSEQDAPQKLLPLPSAWPISPDDAEMGQNQQSQLRLRGNMHWAPPRPQIIFNVHPSPQRKILMAKQNYRCAGCGTKVEQSYMKRFRFCEYYGKYFCQCCHNNTPMYIPARILKKWEFNKYNVSNFSHDLLQQIWNDPVFDANHFDPTLHKRVKVLQRVFQLKLQLYYMKDFIRVCRNCNSNLAEELKQLPSHLVEAPNLYSLMDLLQIKSGEMLNRLKPLVAQCLAHINRCQLCQARGYYCEFCKNHDDLIFPFQTDTVVRCPGCWACFHAKCFVPGKCPKCARIEARKLRDQQVGEGE